MSKSDLTPGLYLSYSSISTYQDCARKYYFRYVRGIVREKSLPEQYGIAFHEALDVYFDTRNVEKTTNKFDEHWPNDAMEDKLRTRARAHKILREYAARYAEDGITVTHKTDRELISFPIPNVRTEDGLSMYYTGKLDKIVHWDQMTLVMEHKTTSRMMMNRFNPNLQIKGYVWLAHQMGYNVTGAMIDVIAIQMSKMDYARDIQTMTHHQEGEFIQLVTDVGNNIVRDLSRSRFTPNFDSCTQYGDCAYRRICSFSPELHEGIIRSDYTVDVPDNAGKYKKEIEQ